MKAEKQKAFEKAAAVVADHLEAVLNKVDGDAWTLREQQQAREALANLDALMEGRGDE